MTTINKIFEKVANNEPITAGEKAIFEKHWTAYALHGKKHKDRTDKGLIKWLDEVTTSLEKKDIEYGLIRKKILK